MYRCGLGGANCQKCSAVKASYHGYRELGGTGGYRIQSPLSGGSGQFMSFGVYVPPSSVPFFPKP